ncbi:endo-1,4-beta-xylanase 5-like [Argentina anserina]|uniref:endo-1,4-beta-xylanase 5-like n=1 Tax=Argentina anserina TaxID=57926 RepID=UPI002176661A|nr:endo-1,4-beta-xylanase 5-like [Potentilla anserina]
MKIQAGTNMLLLLCTLLLATGTSLEANGVPYDYTASIECLANPLKPQYDGGIIVNPELNEGLNGWTTFGNATIEHRKSENNSFIVAHSRSQPHDSILQRVHLESDKLYTFSAWVQVSNGSDVPVTAVFNTPTGYVPAGATIAESNCWTMLKGGLNVDASGIAELYFESENTMAEIWVDSISLQPFTQEQWMSHQDQSIEKIRRSEVKIQTVDAQGNPLPNATISIEQKAGGFPFGCAMNKLILSNTAYQNWFTSRFRVTTFENEMKWYSTETSEGHQDYSVPDAMLSFAKRHNIAVRGHNVFWDDPQNVQGWVKSLPTKRLTTDAYWRARNIVNRYKGQLIAWDVVNENLHFDFFERKMGPSASGIMYNWALKTDGATPLFLNDFNTIEESRDWKSSPKAYITRLRGIQKVQDNYKGRFGIGLESHFVTPNIPYIRSSIDYLAAAKLPIWITELDVQKGPNQAWYLEQILREVHSHPQVQGIVIWSAWQPQGCYRMCLTDNNFKNVATGNVVDKLLHEWGLRDFDTTSATTDTNGFYEASLFHGDYEVNITHPSVTNSSLVHRFNLAPRSESQGPLQLKLSV